METIYDRIREKGVVCVNNFINTMRNRAIHHINLIQEDILAECIPNLEDCAFELIFWSKCLDWSNLGDNDIANRFSKSQKEVLSKQDVDFIDELWDYVCWEREKSFTVDTDEITKIIIECID